MGTFVETSVRVMIELRRDPAGVARVYAQGESLTDDGQVLRRRTLQDITDSLSQARRDGAEALLADLESKLRNLWDIP